MTAQIIVFLDTDGNIHCETPGRNGARSKLDLPSDFAARNPELVNELRTQAAEQEALRKRLNDAKVIREWQDRLDLEAQNNRYVPTHEAELLALRKQQADWDAKYASATACERMNMDFRKTLADEKSGRIAKIRKHDLYVTVLKKHGRRIADKVIPTASDRPKWAKTENSNDSNGRPPKRKYRGPGEIVKITI